MKKVFSLLIIVFAFNRCFAQDNQRVIDSLLNILQVLSSDSREVKLAEGSDTVKANVLNKLGRNYRIAGNYEQALKYSSQAKSLSAKIGFLKGMANASSNLGITYEYRGNYKEALINFIELEKVALKTGDRKSAGSANNGMGVIYVKQGNYEKAMEHYLKSIKIFEELGNKNAVGTTYNNIGNIYFNQGNYQKALENYSNSLKLQLEIGNKSGAALAYGNIGSAYQKQGKYAEALDNHFKCMKICEKLGDKEGVAICYNNIGIIYEEQHNLTEALKYQLKSLNIVEGIGNKELIAVASNSAGSVYAKQGKYSDALNYYTKSLYIQDSIGNKAGKKETYFSLAGLYEKKGEYKKAFEYHKLYSDIKDTLLNEVSSKQIAEMNTKYESEKKEKDIQLLIKDKELQQSEIGRQKLIRNGFVAGLFLTLLLAYVIFNRFKLTRRQKRIIESQNEQIVESINYSKRIQDSLLPSIVTMQQALPGLFVFYLPKNIVSGDFYFFKEFKNYIILACVDCTGHGVPGGFMSTLGSLLLDKIVDDEIMKPSEILIKLNDEIIRILHQRAGGEIQDGMDLSVCLIDRNNRKIEFSGARNGIIVITNNEAKRYKASPLPVGGNYMKKGMPLERNFQTQSIALNSTDWVYMYTDGFIEQLGGQQNSPMNYEQFEKQLIALSGKQSVDEKIDSVQAGLDQWRGTNERTDDVLIVGFQLSN